MAYICPYFGSIYTLSINILFLSGRLEEAQQTPLNNKKFRGCITYYILEVIRIGRNRIELNPWQLITVLNF
ncbi:hypothetical protein FJTKL_00926 [Diaporthe vaccinii]|uniref:Uncharacterized protein n=1 Tax=Diaporthe vaccinii TaxID=105482 RepID=A0ABR4E1U7_9PEZI